MKLAQIYEKCEALAPIGLSNEYCTRYGAYDNSGILIDTGEEIKGVVFSLDFTMQAIEQAVQTGANLIVTHHPAIYGKIADIRVNDFDPLDRKLIECAKRGICVISMHLNLDCAKDGIDESLALALGKTGEEKIMHTLSGGGYGRVYDVAPCSLQAFVDGAKAQLHASRVLVYGNQNQTVTRVASFCGAGADEETVRFAKEQGAQVIVSADFKHHILLLAKENGLNAVVLTHYCAEQYGFEKFYKKIRQSIDLPCSLCTDDSLL